MKKDQFNTTPLNKPINNLNINNLNTYNLKETLNHITVEELPFEEAAKYFALLRKK